jgi:peroxiredoxin
MRRIALFIAAVFSTACMFAQTQQGEDLDEKYATELLSPGTVAPDFTLKDLKGKEVSLSSLKGRRVVLVFWASWCPDCRAEVPELKEMHEKADPLETVFVSVSFDRDFKTLESFAKDNSLPGIQLFDPAGKKDSAVGAAYKVKWIPSLYLIDKEGKVEFGTVIAAKIAAALFKKPVKLPLDTQTGVCEDGSCEP